MATFEDAILMEQILHHVRNSVLTWRTEAAAYKAALLSPFSHSVQTVAARMVGDANEHERLLTRITDLATRNLAKLDAALAVYSITRTTANALKNSLLAVADHVRAASLTTAQEINAEADFILANIPNYERLF